MTQYIRPILAVVLIFVGYACLGIGQNHAHSFFTILGFTAIFIDLLLFISALPARPQRPQVNRRSLLELAAYYLNTWFNTWSI